MTVSIHPLANFGNIHQRAIGPQLQFIGQGIEEWLKSEQHEIPNELANALQDVHNFMASQGRITEANVGGYFEVTFDFFMEELSRKRSSSVVAA